MQLLERPPAGHEPRGEVIEQFRMRGPLAEQSKVARRADQAAAEVMLPDAVHEHPSRQWVAETNDRLSKLKPAASLSKRLCFAWRQDRQKPSRHFLAEFLHIAADVQ